METIDVLIADDHPIYRDGLRVLLTSFDEINLVGEATTGEEAIRLALELQPDVLVMDFDMGSAINGIEATKQILKTSPHISILFLTMFQNEDLLFSAMRAGSRGYLLKGADGQEVLLAIRTLARGGAIFSPGIAQRVIGYFSHLQATQAQIFPDLSEREREILSLMNKGLTYDAIAERLVLSPKTVRNHTSNIFSKLQVANRAEAIIRARDAGLG